MLQNLFCNWPPQPPWIPALGKAREKARSISCVNNLKQHVLAAIQYADDNDSTMAPINDAIKCCDGTAWNGTGNIGEREYDLKGKGLVSAYFADDFNVKLCPAVRNFVTMCQNQNGWCFGGGYGMNGNVGWSAKSPPVLITSIDGPSGKILFGDTFDYAWDSSYGYVIRLYPYDKCVNWYTVSSMSPNSHFRHGGMTNIGWVDGHISSERPEKMGTASSETKNNVGWVRTDTKHWLLNKSQEAAYAEN